MDGAGGAFLFGGKTKERESNNNFFSTAFEEKPPAAAKGDVWVVSHSSATVPRVLVGLVEPISSPGR